MPRTRFVHGEQRQAYEMSTGAVPDLQMPMGPEDEDGVRILGALRAASDAHGSDVSTRAVNAELHRRGHVIVGGTGDAVRMRLLTFAERRKRGRAEWSAPSVVRTTVMTFGGKTSTR